jgi:hypothetical protein
MKRQLAVLFVLAMCVGVSAYAIEPLHSDVPFGFMVGDHYFPAGTYTIDSASTTGAGVVRIRRVDGREAIFSVTKAIQRPSIFEVITTWKLGHGYDDYDSMTQVKETKSSEFCLVFNKYGNEYFLSKMWVQEQGREFPRSAAERAAVASNVEHAPETIVLTAVVR